MIYPIIDQRFAEDTVRSVNDPVRRARMQMRSRTARLRDKQSRSARGLVGTVASVAAVVTAIAVGAVGRFVSISSPSA